MSQKKQVISRRVIVLLLVLWGVWSLRLNANYYGEQDAFRAWMPSAVRNYDIYDYDDVGLMVIRNGYIDEIDNLNIYSHHPPLATWLPALFIKVAGDTETSMRFVFLVATMLASVAFYAMVKYLYDERVAFWSLLFFGITPMVAYFQPSYGHDPLGLMALMLFGLVMLIWLKKPTTIRFFTLISITIFAVFSAWPAVIFVGVIGIFGMFYATWSQRIGIVILGIVAVLGIIVMQLLYTLWWSESTQSLIEAFIWRSSTSSFRADSEPFTAMQWIVVNASHVIYFGAIGLLILGLVGLLAMWRTNATKSYSNAFTLALLSAAILYMIAFRNANFVHTYYKVFLIPALAIGGGIAVVHLRNSHRLWRPISDALLITVLLQSAFVMNQLIATTNEPNLTSVIEYINTIPDNNQMINVTYVGINVGSENVVEYYTMRNVQWNILLSELDELPVTYIYCDRNQDYITEFFDGNAPLIETINNFCSVYLIE